jgi:hypothetical protein
MTHHAVIAGLDPAIHHICKKMDTRVEPGHDVDFNRPAVAKSAHVL